MDEKLQVVQDNHTCRFGSFGHPTRAHQVGEFPTRDMKEKVKTRRVLGQFRAGFFGQFGRADQVFLGIFI
jgi:hypothetical protein